MKILILILLSTSTYAQVSINFVEKVINHKSISSDTLARSAAITSNDIHLQYLTTGDYDVAQSRNYELTTYMGSPQDVEVALMEDKDFYSTVKSVFIYNNFNMVTGDNLLMIYTFD